MTGSAALLLSATALAAGISSALHRATSRRKQRPSRDDPRWNAPPGPPQVAGKKCALCHGRIVLDREGRPCATCGHAVHAGCDDLHRIRAHRPESGVPYR